MKPLFIDKCPFVNPPNIKEKIQWVRPKLVCEVEYAELTADYQLRQTTFFGWRDDIQIVIPMRPEAYRVADQGAKQRAGGTILLWVQ
jgi:ATP-dependent DNA ligase